jgi:hypothetical protein
MLITSDNGYLPPCPGSPHVSLRHSTAPLLLEDVPPGLYFIGRYYVQVVDESLIRVDSDHARVSASYDESAHSNLLDLSALPKRIEPLSLSDGITKAREEGKAIFVVTQEMFDTGRSGRQQLIELLSADTASAVFAIEHVVFATVDTASTQVITVDGVSTSESVIARWFKNKRQWFGVMTSDLKRPWEINRGTQPDCIFVDELRGLRKHLRLLNSLAIEEL